MRYVSPSAAPSKDPPPVIAVPLSAPLTTFCADAEYVRVAVWAGILNVATPVAPVTVSLVRSGKSLPLSKITLKDSADSILFSSLIVTSNVAVFDPLGNVTERVDKT